MSGRARRRLWNVTVVLVALLSSAGATGTMADERLDDERQVGQQVFEELKAKGEIVATSPLYDLLTPIADAVTRTAQPRYGLPFKFYLVTRAAAQRVRDAGRQRLRHRFAAVLRQEHGAAGWNDLP